MAERYWIETLGCPKNQVDSDKIAGRLIADGYEPATNLDDATLVVVNTCAFIEAAREESVESILTIAERRRPDTRLVVTGCLAARSGEEIADAIPEVDFVADVGVPVQLRNGRRWQARSEQASTRSSIDLLDGPRRRSADPWAYVKVAEGCDRRCGFCAIPSFRGPQQSRSTEDILEEVRSLQVKEIILVAQDLASYGKDLGDRSLVELVQKVQAIVSRVRLLYLYPSSLNDALIKAIIATGIAYFDLSLQHVSRPLLQSMRRFGSSDRFLERIDYIRQLAPQAALRSSFICGYPGETEEDHDALLAFIEKAQLDWAGFFTFSDEEGTYAASLPGHVPEELALERLREASALQDAITASLRRDLIGTTVEVLVDRPGAARSHREAPEIDGIISVPNVLIPGTTHMVRIVEASGPDLEATPVDVAVLA